MATGSIQPFSPINVITIAALTSSVATPITPADSQLVYNGTTGTIYVAFGGIGASPVATIAAGFPVPAGARQLFAGGAYTGSVAVIAATAGAVFVTSGSGTAY